MKTTRKPFSLHGPTGPHVLEVCPGIPADDALEITSTLISCSLDTLYSASTEMSPKIWGALFNLETSRAMIEALIEGRLTNTTHP